jgi:hypothetical protein
METISPQSGAEACRRYFGREFFIWLVCCNRVFGEPDYMAEMLANLEREGSIYRLGSSVNKIETGNFKDERSFEEIAKRISQ